MGFCQPRILPGGASYAFLQGHRTHCKTVGALVVEAMSIEDNLSRAAVSFSVCLQTNGDTPMSKKDTVMQCSQLRDVWFVSIYYIDYTETPYMVTRKQY